MQVEEIAATIVDSALKVHRQLGPGLLESAYQACLRKELEKRGLIVECEVSVPLFYDGEKLDVGYRLDMLVEGNVIIENKAIDEVLPLHQAQLITYMRLMGKSLGFLINWNVPLIRDGLKRFVLNHKGSPSRYQSDPRYTSRP